ncbi:DedA family protein [Rhodopila sp.]|uniref:DedA family protein n=1 Tax=Rhodopila sp. TaxID=2480087 RepID=UPI002B5908F7|nr:DedA family protein [Rhodopila sp.]HVZ07652.1 DedA family protein [Rhodopila sp.]
MALSWLGLPVHLPDLVHHGGYAGVFLILMLESMGLPLPGESLMIAAALYAATTGQLDILVLVPVAAAGAILGDQIGFGIGRWIGFPALARWGRKIGLGQDRLDLGWYLFRRYGGPVVFLGRFVAILRTLAALLAGANRMKWHSFLLWNGLGGFCWAAAYGFGAYLLGDTARHLHGPIGIGLGAAGATGLATAFWLVKRNEQRLLAEARQAMAANPDLAA